MFDGFAGRGVKGFIDKCLEVVNPRESGVRVEEEEIVGVHDQDDEFLIRFQGDTAEFLEVHGLAVGVLAEHIDTTLGASFPKIWKIIFDPGPPGLTPECSRLVCAIQAALDEPAFTWREAETGRWAAIELFVGRQDAIEKSGADVEVVRAKA